MCGGTAALLKALREAGQIEPTTPELYLGQGVEQQAVISERVLSKGAIGHHQPGHAALQGTTAFSGPALAFRGMGAGGTGQPATADEQGGGF
jgi:hypothetical protein